MFKNYFNFFSKEKASWRYHGFLIVTASFFIGLLSLVNVTFLTNNFRVSIAIILIPVLASLVPDFPMALTALFSAVIVFILRVLLYALSGGRFLDGMGFYWHEIFFYAGYGLILSLFCRYIKRPLGELFFFIMCTDFLANTIELYLRIGESAFTMAVVLRILSVAFLRSICAVIIIRIFAYYKIMLLKKEDSLRYQKLVIMMSELNAEMFWIKKSSDLIENTMSLSFHLYTQLKEENAFVHAENALSIAKDIHEIKKEYMMVVRGLNESVKDLSAEDSMDFKKIFDTLLSAANRNEQVTVRYSIEHNFYTNKHYYLMSVMKNLLDNAIEAAKEDMADIQIHQYLLEGQIYILLTDHGPGIKEEHLQDIFLPTFSTKINYETGEVNRGLGLCIVKEIVEDLFQGKITVSSKEGLTTFTIIIPEEMLRDKNE